MLALSSMLREGFKKSNGNFKIFEKALKMENCPKIVMEVVVRKDPVLGIAIENFDKTL